MNQVSGKEALDFKAVALLTGLCMVWGVNAVAIKFSNAGVPYLLCRYPVRNRCVGISRLDECEQDSSFPWTRA